MSKITKACLIGAAGAALAAPLATAQDSWFQRDRYEAVQERPQPEFDPEPVRVGVFLLNPELLLGVEHNDNVFAAPDSIPASAGTEPGPESDTIFRIAPRVFGRTDWNRHEISANLGVDHYEFTDFGSESNTNVTAGVRGRLDVNRELSLNAGVSGVDGFESRRGITGNRFIELVEYQSVGFDGGAIWTRDRLRASGGVSTRTNEYEDTTTRPAVTAGGARNPFPQGFRDRTDNELNGRLEFAVSPDVSVFGGANINNREYDNDSTRDAEGYGVNGGVNFELSALIRGEIALGYFEDEVADAPGGPQTADGLSVDGRLQWFPTRLTTITASAGRGAVDPGFQASANAIQTNARLGVDHELRRNVVLFADVGTSSYDFDSTTGGSDDLFDVGFGARYKLNKRAHLEGYYRYYDRSNSTNVATTEFNQNVVGIALRLFP